MIERRSLFGALVGALGMRRAFAQAPSAPDLAKVPRITLKEFRALHAKKAVLAIDVRDPHAFDSGHIPGAMNVSFVDVEISANRLLKEKRPIVAYCA
jgi:3-mercaptopyruvate sulfurtransferase SseA